ncbi:hypothetical protein C8Q73DRAFT_182218 [Cubamyces lactineus]|nr:hypothetical protein C8Q73DRAFT_182218 [Cubamyces lactineus]
MRNLRPQSSKAKPQESVRGSLPQEARDIRNVLYTTESHPPTLAAKLTAFNKIKKIPGTDWYKRHTHLTWCSGKECEPARKAAKAAQGKAVVVQEEGAQEGAALQDGPNLHGAPLRSFLHRRKP